MSIRIDKTLKTPVYVQIAAEIKRKILSAEMGVGTTLPSERALASILCVHRNTVIKAYHELIAEELIESVHGVGYVVVSPQHEAGRRGQEEKLPKVRPKRVNWTNQIKPEYLDMEITFDDLFQRFGNEKIYALGSGIPPAGMYDEKKVAADITDMVSGQGRSQYFYSPYKGDPFLRKKLASFLSTKGIKVSSGQIQVLTETNQALDFIVMLLIKPGDNVIMEEPVSPDVYRAMELAGAVIRTVPMDDFGMDCDMLEIMVQRYKPKFIYINSSFHDPTGMTLSMERRKKIIEISNTYRIAIVEEDAASELVYEGSRMQPIKAFDTEENVIYIYSFSLTFMPGLSLAFVAGNKDLIRSMSYLVSVRMVGTDWLSQKLVAKYLDDGTYYGVLDNFRSTYSRKQKLVCEMLDTMKDIGVEYTKPSGGVYIWCKLPAGIDSKSFVSKAYSRGLAILPGYIFYPFKNGGRDHIRINYSFETEERLQVGMNLLRQVLREELAHKK
ncbi:MAG: PLP-dependent aminotransferase family protein [Firmicutes bacterium]|nr:PLP-dependent aminotransferase family protein [Bacillota bacterium]